MNERNNFNALVIWPEWTKSLEKQAQQSGAFQTGIESDRKNRGTAINTDLYGYDKSKNLIVIQVRQAILY